MGFDEISSKYAELDQAGREDMLLEMFAKRNYNACIETQIADEGPAFIARIIRPMYSAYRYLAMRLLATLAERQGLNAFCQVLMDSHFSELIPRADLSLVDKYITTDNNPMHEPYQRLGPQLFVALWDCHFASTHDIYLWTRSSPQRCHEDVLLALVRDHANDPTGHCGEIIRDAFLTERAIAMAKKQHWLLWDQIPLCAALIDAVGPCIHHLLSALLQIREVLVQDANQELDNLIFIAFMLDFVTRRLSYRSAEEIKSRYYRWLIKCPSSLQEIDCIVDP